MKKPITGVTIVDTGQKSETIGKKAEEKEVFLIPYGVPEDVVSIQPTKKKKGLRKAHILSIEKASPHRTTPFCQHFGTCGGCNWQHMTYEKQLDQKTRSVAAAFERIGQLDFPELSPIMPAQDTTHYRNRLDFGFSGYRWLTPEEINNNEDKELDRRGLGFHIPGMFQKIVDIEECHLQQNPSNEIRNFVKKKAKESGLPFYDVVKHKGFYRSLIIKTTETGDVMVLLIVTEEREAELKALFEELLAQFPQISSLYYAINTKLNDSWIDLPLKHYAGNTYITEALGDLRLRLGPKSFYQTNSRQSYHLFSEVKKLAALDKTKVLYDLYCGVGSIGLFLAKEVKQVVGIEMVSEAVAYAQKNAEINQIENAAFECGEVEKVLADCHRKYGKADLVTVDPPRAGLHPKALQHLLSLEAPEIIYVSCNPSTQARDLKLMSTHYKIEKIQPVDMFPQTFHVENIVHLTKK